jgi:hypothetical protein
MLPGAPRGVFTRVMPQRGRYVLRRRTPRAPSALARRRTRRASRPRSRGGGLGRRSGVTQVPPCWSGVRAVQPAHAHLGAGGLARVLRGQLCVCVGCLPQAAAPARRVRLRPRASSPQPCARGAGELPPPGCSIVHATARAAAAIMVGRGPRGLAWWRTAARALHASWLCGASGTPAAAAPRWCVRATGTSGEAAAGWCCRSVRGTRRLQGHGKVAVCTACVALTPHRRPRTRARAAGCPRRRSAAQPRARRLCQYARLPPAGRTPQ